MREALAEATLALAEGEVPVGCVFVHDDVIIARGHNRTNLCANALEHAELVALRSWEREDSGAASEYTLPQGTQLYVTVEPCLMCGAALLYRRVSTVFYGCSNPHFGGNGSILNLHCDGQLSAAAAVYSSFGGFLKAEAVALLQDFYKQENPAAPEDKRCRKEQHDATTTVAH